MRPVLVRTICGSALILIAASCGGSPASVTLKMDSFAIAAGTEGYRCQEFFNPLGEDLQITGYRSSLSKGAHHLLAFAVAAPTQTALFDCGPAMDPDNMLFEAETAGDNQVSYPNGVATLLKKGAGIRLRIHFLNSGSQEITTNNQIELSLAEVGTVKQHVGPIHLSNTGINVPAGSPPTQVTKECKLDHDITVAWFGGHMHSHTLDYKITSGGTLLYETTDWTAPPLKVFEPPLALKAGDSFSWSCGYGPVGEKPLQFGLSLTTNEMCNVVGAYFLPDGGEPTPLTCAGQDAGCLRCIEAMTSAQPDKACTDNGPPSSAQRVSALRACTCNTCATACAASSCAGRAPDGDCASCLKAQCSAESTACFNEP